MIEDKIMKNIKWRSWMTQFVFGWTITSIVTEKDQAAIQRHKLRREVDEAKRAGSIQADGMGYFMTK